MWSEKMSPHKRGPKKIVLYYGLTSKTFTLDPYAHAGFPEQDLTFKPAVESYQPKPYEPEPYVPPSSNYHEPEPYRPEPEPYRPPTSSYHEPEPYQPPYEEPGKLCTVQNRLEPLVWILKNGWEI